MINYFISSINSCKDIKDVCSFANEIKQKLNNEEFEIFDINKINDKIISIKNYAIKIDNEKLANSAFVFNQYIDLFINLSKYFVLLQTGEYDKSWVVLQDCFDISRIVLKFSENYNEELQNIVTLLQKYEKLYPYKLFSSVELIVQKCHCNICNKSMLGLNCKHRRGELYWGVMATEIVDKADIQAIAVVKNPENKRCILELSEYVNDKSKFLPLQTFLDLKLGFLTDFEIKVIDNGNYFENKIYPKQKIILNANL